VFAANAAPYFSGKEREEDKERQEVQEATKDVQYLCLHRNGTQVLLLLCAILLVQLHSNRA